MIESSFDCMCLLLQGSVHLRISVLEEPESRRT